MHELEKALKTLLSSEEYSITAVRKAARKAASLEDALTIYRELTQRTASPDLVDWQNYQACLYRYDFNAKCRAELGEAPDVLTGLACRDSKSEYMLYTQQMEEAAKQSQQYLEGARRWAKLTNTKLREL